MKLPFCYGSLFALALTTPPAQAEEGWQRRLLELGISLRFNSGQANLHVGLSQRLIHRER